MSSALVRQALELVDPEETIKDKPKRRGNSERLQGQVLKHPYKKTNKSKNIVKSKEEITEENIKKLLALSAPAADSKIAEKIVERAIKGKPLADKIEIKENNSESIFFPKESFKNFEKNESDELMEISDQLLGKFILVTTLSVYCIFVFWVNSYPFIDEDLSIYEYIPNPRWVLLFCALWGFIFIGGLMLFTLYHIYPYL